MHINIVDIGNSQGIRLPKALLSQCGFDKKVHVTIENNKMILSKPVKPKKKKPREGWKEAIEAARIEGEKQGLKEAELWPYFANAWDETGWKW